MDEHAVKAHSGKAVGDLGSNAREGSFGTGHSIGVRKEHSKLDTGQALQNNIRSELARGGGINIDAKRDVSVQGADLHLEQAANAAENKGDDRLAALYGSKVSLTLYNGLNPASPQGGSAVPSRHPNH